jgi:hypothetical protein
VGSRVWLADAESEEVIGFVLLLYGEEFADEPEVTFARFLPLTA